MQYLGLTWLNNAEAVGASSSSAGGNNNGIQPAALPAAHSPVPAPVVEQGNGSGRGGGRGRGRGRGPGLVVGRGRGRGLVVGRGRGRGRGRGGGRGGGGGRGEANMAAEADDSGDSADDEAVTENAEDEAFAVRARNIDGESDDDDEPIAAPAEYDELPDGLGDANHCINMPFVPGGPMGADYLRNKYGHRSETDIVLSLAVSFFNSLRECSNVVPAANISDKDLYAYHAFLTMRTLFKFDKNNDYWYPNELFSFAGTLSSFSNDLSRERFYHIRKHLKGYKPLDDTVDKDRGWKVLRPVIAVQQSFREVLPNAGEYLSLDEGMAKGSSSRNPIYCSLGKAKPLEGFRFFLLCDYVTKIVVNFELDTKRLNAQNCAGRPGGFVGGVVDDVISGALLSGRWHRVMADNYYCKPDVVVHMRDNRNVLVGGTMQKRYTTAMCHFGNGKRPKPSVAHPRGKLLIAKKAESNFYVYGWMDSASCYFIDPVAGPGNQEVISRKSTQGDRLNFNVPSFIVLYNRYMHAVDVFDQVRKMFGCDLTNGTKKYTVRMFEILWSMILAQGYNIHRVVHAGNPMRLKSHSNFKVSVIKGMLNHAVVRPPANPNGVEHELLQYARGTGIGNRCMRVNCRSCPNSFDDGSRNFKRTTNFYCSVCKVGFHPSCFITYHGARDFNVHVSPPKRPRSPNITRTTTPTPTRARSAGGAVINDGDSDDSDNYA